MLEVRALPRQPSPRPGPTATRTMSVGLAVSGPVGPRPAAYALALRPERPKEQRPATRWREIGGTRCVDSCVPSVRSWLGPSPPQYRRSSCGLPLRRWRMPGRSRARPWLPRAIRPQRASATPSWPVVAGRRPPGARAPSRSMGPARTRSRGRLGERRRSRTPRRLRAQACARGDCVAGVDTGSVVAHGGPGSSIALGAHVTFETCFDLNAKVQYLVSGTKAEF